MWPKNMCKLSSSSGRDAEERFQLGKSNRTQRAIPRYYSAVVSNEWTNFELCRSMLLNRYAVKGSLLYQLSFLFFSYFTL